MPLCTLHTQSTCAPSQFRFFQLDGTSQHRSFTFFVTMDLSTPHSEVLPRSSAKFESRNYFGRDLMARQQNLEYRIRAGGQISSRFGKWTGRRPARQMTAMSSRHSPRQSLVLTGQSKLHRLFAKHGVCILYLRTLYLCTLCLRCSRKEWICLEKDVHTIRDRTTTSRACAHFGTARRTILSMFARKENTVTRIDEADLAELWIVHLALVNVTGEMNIRGCRNGRMMNWRMMMMVVIRSRIGHRL